MVLNYKGNVEFMNELCYKYIKYQINGTTRNTSDNEDMVNKKIFKLHGSEVFVDRKFSLREISSLSQKDL